MAARRKAATGGSHKGARPEGPALRSTSLLKSFGYAFLGLWYALRTQRNMRIHSVIAVAVIGLGALLDLSAVEMAVVMLAIALVLVAELANTAIEASVDVASPEIHPLAKMAKDVAAGAVLVAALVALAVGALVLGPHVWAAAGR